MAKLHESMSDEIIKIVEQSEVTGEPILRNMEYQFPGEFMEKIKDQFMLGDKILVAPVIKKGERNRKVVLPSGNDWKYIPTETLYKGGQTIIVDAPLEVLPYFERV